MARREQFASEESDFSVGPSLVQNAAVADSFLEATRILDPNSTTGDPKTELSRWLSLKSIISATSSFAMQQTEAAGDISHLFSSIGVGLCGEVFDDPGTGTVVKRSHSAFNAELWNDFQQHANILGAIEFAFDRWLSVYLMVPGIKAFISRDNDAWWSTDRQKWPAAKLREPADLIRMQRILPLPKKIRESLTSVYCPPHLRMDASNDPCNRDCLIRVYLGVRRPTGRPGKTEDEKFSLRNFEADLSVLDNLELEKEEYAKAMGVALAVMHWECQTNAQDVEFVLGTTPTKMLLTYAEIRSLPPGTDSEMALTFKRRTVQL
ncbi:MAG: hypothetical protein Q9190_000720 [Brigantiaea leucoxantha]